MRWRWRTCSPTPTVAACVSPHAPGCERYFGLDELDRIHLAVGYGGQPLRAGHGAPVRLIVAGRRGPWWVKWVTTVEPSDRPSWLQSPLPLT